jgi:LmbE family N-acetylglucosaminyl deacetylase
VSDGAPATALVLSPHLDDGVLSLGALIAELVRRGTRVRVVTIFTEAAPPPHGRAARRYLDACGADDAQELWARRRAGDLRVVAEAGAEAVHLGEVDALFRAAGGVRGRLGALGRMLPEVALAYPTYRFDIAYGRVAASDGPLVARIADRIRGLSGDGATRVFAPAGVGRHTDHVIVRRAALAADPAATLYADQPYAFRGGDDPPIPATHAPWVFAGDLGAKSALASGYRTQVEALFTHGEVPPLPERLWGGEPIRP